MYAPAVTPGVTDGGRQQLIIDVDTGIDDALALLYACASAEAEILAVTCVSGNVAARQVAANTLGVLELAGRSRRRGGTRPRGPAGSSVDDCARDPRAKGRRLRGAARASRAAVSERHAADLIIAEARRRPGEITLITLGPLTNLAVALVREPELPKLLRGLVMMAGSYRSAGNTAPTSEWNVAVDPEAMQVVLAGWTAGPRRATPVALGLDVTERAKLTPESPGATARVARGTRIRRPVLTLRRRRAALLHGVPQPLRRLLRRVHPRCAGGRGGSRPDPRQDRIGHRRGGAGRESTRPAKL